MNNKKTKKKTNEDDADQVPVSLTVEAVEGDLAAFLPTQPVAEDGQTWRTRLESRQSSWSWAIHSPSLTVNHRDVLKRGHISVPPAADLHTTHVPPRVGLLQLLHGYREHLLDLVVNDADFILGWIGFARPSQTGAELPRAPLTPVLYVAGILGLVGAGDGDGLALHHLQLVSSGHMAEELCWKEQNCFS